MRHGKILVGTLALFVGLTSCTGAGAGTRASASAPAAGTTASSAPISIRDLHDQFTSDRSRAEKKCYGRSVTVRAVVLKTGASEYGTPTIEASDVENGRHLVSLVLPYDDRRAESFRRLESVKTGQEIVATGTCHLFADSNDTLVFKNSEIIE
jgi:hypothetical protein